MSANKHTNIQETKNNPGDKNDTKPQIKVPASTSFFHPKKICCRGQNASVKDTHKQNAPKIWGFSTKFLFVETSTSFAENFRETPFPNFRRHHDFRKK